MGEVWGVKLINIVIAHVPITSRYIIELLRLEKLLSKVTQQVSSRQ
jgi:hypothetical protein